MLNLDHDLPDFLHLPHLDSWRVVGYLGLVSIAFLLAWEAKVKTLEPDLRADALR